MAQPNRYTAIISYPDGDPRAVVSWDFEDNWIKFHMAETGWTRALWDTLEGCLQFVWDCAAGGNFVEIIEEEQTNG